MRVSDCIYCILGLALGILSLPAPASAQLLEAEPAFFPSTPIPAPILVVAPQPQTSINGVDLTTSEDSASNRTEGTPSLVPPDAATTQPTEPIETTATTAAPAPSTQPPRRELTIVVGGDLGLNGHMQPVAPHAALKHGANIPWALLTERLAPLIDGDLNFANLETIVTERNDLRPEPKTFNFRSHPAGVRHLVKLGLNLLSTANNHAMDFGSAGAMETISLLDRLKQDGLLAHAGLGRDREEAGHPSLIDIKGARVAFSAIGIVSGGFPHHRASHDRPGQLAWQSPEDFEDATQRLAFANAEYRILSVHHGSEREVRTDRNAIRKLRHEAVAQRGIDLVVGHHAHVVQGIEVTQGRIIFYGLGNLLHPGMQNMAGFGICRDYGLLARIHLASDETGHLVMRAVEAIPLADMHLRATRMSADEAQMRIHVLNHLAAGLDDTASDSRGMRFSIRADGSGLYCAPGADVEPGKAGALCRGWTGSAVTSSLQRSRIAASCGFGVASTANSAGSQASTGAVRVTARGTLRPQLPLVAGN